jgi:hypothetical protein
MKKREEQLANSLSQYTKFPLMSGCFVAVVLVLLLLVVVVVACVTVCLIIVK